MKAKATHFEDFPEPWLLTPSIPTGTSPLITEASESAPRRISA